MVSLVTVVRKFTSSSNSNVEPVQAPSIELMRKVPLHPFKGTPGERCLPLGVPAEMMTPNPFKLVQIPGLVLLVFEQFSYFRQILMIRPELARTATSAAKTFSVKLA
jgi:hypothetical protein